MIRLLGSAAVVRILEMIRGFLIILMIRSWFLGMSVVVLYSCGTMRLRY